MSLDRKQQKIDERVESICHVNKKILVFENVMEIEIKHVKMGAILKNIK